jgi:hypothetical protein
MQRRDGLGSLLYDPCGCLHAMLPGAFALLLHSSVCRSLDPWETHGVELVPQDLSTVTRQQAFDYFTNTWATTETLFSALQGA